MRTVCAYCGVGCSFEVGDRLKGAKDYPVNEGMSCSKGISQLESIKKNRRLHTYINGKVGSYEDAIKIIAKKIKNTKPEKIGFYLSGQMLNEDYYVANKLAKGYIKTPNIDTNSRTCMASAVVGYKKSIGSDYVPVRINDINHTDLLILIGANPAESHVVLFNKIKKAKKNGMKVIVIDPRFSDTAKIADSYLSITPGSDIDFLNLVAIRIIKENLIDKKFIEAHIDGFDELKENILKLNEDELLKKSGIGAKDFEKFMDILKDSKKFITAWTMGINQSVQGVDKNLAIMNLHLITGQINKKGSGPFSLTGQPNAMGGREVGGLATTLAVHLDYTDENIKKVAKFWGVDEVCDAPGLSAFEMIKAANEGKLDVLMVCHTDPVYHLPNRKLVEEAFRKVDLVIEINAYAGSETSKFAHIQIPAAPFGEKDGTQTNMDRTLTRSIAFKEKKAKQDWEIFADIAKALGFSGFEFNSSEEVFNEYKEMTRLSPDIDIYKADYKELETKPFVWGENALKKGFLTENKKAKLYFVENKNLHEMPDNEYPFILLTGRTRDQWHSGSKTVFVEKLKKYKPLSFVEINEDDAKNLGINDGDEVRVISRYGELKTKAKITNIKKGSVFIPISDRRVNFLTNPKIDPLSKEPDYNHTAVKVVK